MKTTESDESKLLGPEIVIGNDSPLIQVRQVKYKIVGTMGLPTKKNVITSIFIDYPSLLLNIF